MIGPIDMFETYIVRPIFNLLLFLYETLGDFGLAIIAFTIITRLAFWPLLKRQLHQSKLMRKMQPEIKEIRARNKGDKPSESAEMMALYKKHGVSPFSSFGLLLIQLPVFFGLFAALRALIDNPDRILRLPYDPIRTKEATSGMISDIVSKTDAAINSLSDLNLKQSLLDKLGTPVNVDSLVGLPKEELSSLFADQLIRHTANSDGSVVNGLVPSGFNGVSEALVTGPFFEQKLFGVIDLSGSAVGENGLYIPVLMIALLAGVFQYFQTKQLTATNKKSKSIRELIRESGDTGKEPDTAEINAAVGGSMSYIFPPLIAFISATSPAGLALYFATSGLTGLIQQRTVLSQDVEEMQLVADVVEQENKPTSSKKKKKATKNRPAKKSNKKNR